VALKGLEGRAAVVTGAAAGIGRATAERLLEEGSSVVGVDVDADALARTATELGERMLAVVADVSSEADVARAFAAAQERFGRIDALHNNAGIDGPGGDLAEMSAEDFDRLVRINLRGVFLVQREMLRIAREQGGPAAIVNTASGAASHAVPGLGAYSATKAGVIALTRAAALENATRGIRVNAVLPGPVETRLFAALPDEVRAVATAGVPLGRLGEPHEIAAIVAWLLSDECPFATGELFPVDGGESA
jgi:NAD(P)-dependent dehydrogenase (short-subunit alcohol dehydrogenase family)